MSQPNCPASIFVCAMRVCRLTSTGAKVSGATAGYVSGAIAKLSPKPVYLPGPTASVVNGCGGLAAAYKGRPVLQRYEFDLEVVTPDPELDEVLAGSSLVLGTYGSTRTAADGATTSGSPNLVSTLAAWTTNDVGRTVSGAGIPGGTTILSITNATTVVMSANATATASGVTITITPPSQSIGTIERRVGAVPTNNVSLEVWARAVLPNGTQDTVLPWWHYVFPLVQADRVDLGDLDGSADGHHQNFNGLMLENVNYGTGPFGDFPASASPLNSCWARFRDANIPTAQCGYVTV